MRVTVPRVIRLDQTAYGLFRLSILHDVNRNKVSLGRVAVLGVRDSIEWPAS